MWCWGTSSSAQKNDSLNVTKAALLLQERNFKRIIATVQAYRVRVLDTKIEILVLLLKKSIFSTNWHKDSHIEGFSR